MGFDLACFVVERLHENWTLEEIAGWLKSGAEQLTAISHETIYLRFLEALIETVPNKIHTMLTDNGVHSFVISNSA